MPLNFPPVPLSAIVGIHFVLVSWGSLLPFLSYTYLYTNFFVLILGLWAIKDDKSTEPVQFFLFGKAFTILNDIILLGVYFGPYNLHATSVFQFSAAMAIINLLLKPITCLVLFKNWQDRGGTAGYDDLQGGQPSSGYGGPPGGYSAPPSGGYMPPQGSYGPPPESKGYRPPQTTYNAPTVGP